MSLQDIESAVADLPAEQLTAFAQWFEEYLADAWDRRIEEDIRTGRVDEAGRRADAEFEAGRSAQSAQFTVDVDVKSICDEIAGMKSSPEEWLRHDKKTFWRATCMCVYRAHGLHGGAFRFSVRGAGDLRCDAAPLTLEDVLAISEGRLREIAVLPSSRVHPEDMGMRRVDVDPK